jgi:hypothetical protein
MKDYQSLKNILFFDIETVPAHVDFGELSERLQPLWLKKAKQLGIEEEGWEDAYAEKAGIYAEFGKIVAISVGMFHQGNNEMHFTTKSFAGHNEAELLNAFREVLRNRPGMVLAGHNIKEFDIPFVARRMLINGLDLPNALDVAGKKPWEIPHLDTLELWKFGDWKSYTSLDLLAAVFAIPTSKDDIDGSQVARVYYEEGDVDRIALYCQKDVQLTAKIYLKLKSFPSIPDNHYKLS